MTPERTAALKQQALKSIAARAKNLKAPGVSMIAVTPHEALAFVKMTDALNKLADAFKAATVTMDQFKEIMKDSELEPE